MKERQEKSLINILGKCIELLSLIVIIIKINILSVFNAYHSMGTKSAKALQKF